MCVGVFLWFCLLSGFLDIHFHFSTRKESNCISRLAGGKAFLEWRSSSFLLLFFLSCGTIIFRFRVSDGMDAQLEKIPAETKTFQTCSCQWFATDRGTVF